ncbi:Asparagine--tRNA ligase [Candidatus Calditenuaceae archaeon HR02]|nr:Asparagine--tRNA ligase [Candidatus Calditenuaceae archaeon HR02]
MRNVSEVFDAGEGVEVELRGWVWRKRSHGRLLFIDLRDSTGVIQVAVNAGRVGPESFEEASKASRESSVLVRGIIAHDPRAPGGVEVRCTYFKTIGQSLDDFPIRKGVTSRVLYDNRHLYLRSPRVTAVMRIRSNLIWAVHEFFRSRGFVEIDCPTLVTAAVEGGATLFEVNYFGKKVYLTQSVQFYQEAAIYSLERVYSIQPSFRAEKSRTTRHLTEFWHVEAEMAYAGFEDLLKTIEELVRYIVIRVDELSKKELRTLGRRIRTEEVEGPFPRITYAEALDILRRHGVDAEWGIDIGADEEKIISGEFEKPVFLTHFPKKLKAFYHKPDPSNREVTLSADLLAPRGNGEIVGSGVRIDDYEELRSRILEEGLRPEDYYWYLDLRKYGSVPHAGFGMGVERVLKWILDLPHVRMAAPFPRTPTRIQP